MGKQSRNTARQPHIAGRRRAKRNRILAGGGGLIIAGLLVAIIATLVDAAGGEASAEPNAPTTLVAPAGATAAGAIPVGDPTAPVRIEVYLDYMCPYCGRFDRANAGDLNRLIAAGTVRVEIYPLSFLDKTSNGTRYSTRAANAVATVADRAPDHVLALTQALFARQPHEGGDGLTDDQIASLAGAAGVPPDVTTAFTARTFVPWITELTASAFAGGITGTPTVKINGTVFEGDLYTAGPLADAITTAKGR